MILEKTSFQKGDKAILTRVVSSELLLITVIWNIQDAESFVYEKFPLN